MLYTHLPFAEELFRFLVGISGRTFLEYKKHDKSGWSPVVWDLLEHSMTYLLVSHDADVIAHMSDRAAFMASGVIQRFFDRTALELGEAHSAEPVEQLTHGTFERGTLRRRQ